MKGEHQPDAEELKDWIRDITREEDVGGKHGLIVFSFPEVMLFSLVSFKISSKREARVDDVIRYVSRLWPELSSGPVLQ